MKGTGLLLLALFGVGAWYLLIRKPESREESVDSGPSKTGGTSAASPAGTDVGTSLLNAVTSAFQLGSAILQTQPKST